MQIQNTHHKNLMMKLFPDIYSAVNELTSKPGLRTRTVLPSLSL